MTQNLMMVCEAKLVLENQGNAEPTGKIEAVVTTWGAREGADGRRFNYQPEAFMDWAESFSKENRPLPMFVNHDADSIPVGEWHSFEFDDKGMTAQGRIYMNTTQGSDLYQVMCESPNMFGGVSVGAYAEDYAMVNADGEPDDSDEAYFQITKGGLREVSVVMYPNNPMAEVQKLEYFRADGTADLKVLERALRDASLSKKDAVTAASIFKKVLEVRDVSKPIENAPQLSDSDVDVTEAEILKALSDREILKQLNTRLKG
jgi:HK97 family phage prohead protease